MTNLDINRNLQIFSWLAKADWIILFSIFAITIIVAIREKKKKKPVAQTLIIGFGSAIIIFVALFLIENFLFITPIYNLN